MRTSAQAPLPVGGTPEEPPRVFTFALSGSDLALPLGAVREVVPMASLLRPPGLPHALEGLLRLGDVPEPVPVLRLDRLFGLPEADVPGLHTPIVLMRRGEDTPGERLLGLLVERAHGIVDVAPGAMAELPPASVFADCAPAQVALPGGGSAALLSPERLLLREERERLDSFLREAERRGAEWGAGGGGEGAA